MRFELSVAANSLGDIVLFSVCCSDKYAEDFERHEKLGIGTPQDHIDWSCGDLLHRGRPYSYCRRRSLTTCHEGVNSRCLSRGIYPCGDPFAVGPEPRRLRVNLTCRRGASKQETRQKAGSNQDRMPHRVPPFFAANSKWPDPSNGMHDGNRCDHDGRQDMAGESSCLGAIYDGLPEEHWRASELATDRPIESTPVAEACHHPNLIDRDPASAKEPFRKRQLV